MTANLQNPIFADETKAREWLEARVWPNGPVCPHCGSSGDDVTALNGKAHRPGVYQCNSCREQFTVTVKTVFERSKIPLSKWLAALFLLTASKKGVSAHQVHRSLGISYKSSWFMMHRLREAMRTGGLAPPMGGTDKVIEADETYFGSVENPTPQGRAAVATSHRAVEARQTSARCWPLLSAAAMSARSMSPRPIKTPFTASCAPTSRRKAASTPMKANCTASRRGISHSMKRSNTVTMSMCAATRPQTRLKAISQSSNAA
jgi:transposase-like protein